MKKNNLLILATITILVILAAAISSQMRAPQVDVTKEILLLGLEDQINNISSIEIHNNNDNVNLTRQENRWVIGNADNYPALFNKIKQTLINLSELKILEEKTDNPDRYSILGVEDPDKERSRSLRLIVSDSNGIKLVDLITGLPRQSSGSKPGLYVRKTNDSKALLVEGRLDISAEKKDWFERYLVDISSNHIQRVQINHADGDTFAIQKETRAQPDFDLLDDKGASKSISKIVVNRISTCLEAMRADDVVSLENFTFPENTTITDINTFNGLKISVKTAKIDSKHWAHFTFSTGPAMDQDESADTSFPVDTLNVSEEARILNESLSNWVYLIPDFKYEALTMTTKDITKPVPAGDFSLPLPENE